MLFGIALVMTAALTAASTPDPSERFSEAIGAALQADEVRALAALDGVNLSALSAGNQAAATCMRERFGPNSRAAPPASESVADRALGIYRDYWHTAMTHPERRAAEELRLEARLGQLLGTRKVVHLDTLETMLSEALKAEGVHSLQGRTGLLRELMMWSKQDEKLMHVALPEGEHDVKVMLLDDFKSLGWGDYATCGRASTGGWTTDDALFAVASKYPSLDDEEFRVTFLGHEAQHFADKMRFKNLKSWELEYRAKLTELAQANSTRAKVLGKFIDDQGDDPASPHSYANRLVLTNLERKLGVASAKDLANAGAGRLQAAAIELLHEDTMIRTGGLAGH
jgi:hypothetical protein